MDSGKVVMDAASVAVVLGTLNSWLPPIAASLTIIWTLIRIYESKTVQRWVQRWFGRNTCDACEYKRNKE